MKEVKFTITTTFEKEDYKKFLYIATFKRNRLVIPFIGIISLLGSLISNINQFNFISIGLTWTIFILLSLMVICIQIEVKSRKRFRTDHTGIFGSKNILKFYDDKVVMVNEAYHSKGELEYKNFHELCESKDFFLFYLSSNQANLIRKKDIYSEEDFRSFIVGKFQNRYQSI